MTSVVNSYQSVM